MRAVNLIPSEQRDGGSVGAGRSGGAVYAVLALVLGLALLTFLYASASHDVSSKRAEAATLSAKAQQAQSAASALAPYTSFMQMREARTKAVAELVDTRFDWAHAFHELGRVIPSGVSVDSLSGAVGSAAGPAPAPAAPAPTPASPSATPASAAAPASVAVTSTTPAGSIPAFTLSGCAVSQQTVAQLLQRLRLIDGVKEVQLQSSTKGGSGGGGTAGGCDAGYPAYTVQVTFDPLPSAAASAAATKPGARSVANSPVAGAPTPTPTTAEGALR